MVGGWDSGYLCHEVSGDQWSLVSDHTEGAQVSGLSPSFGHEATSKWELGKSPPLFFVPL